jgi:hypothetical protein
LTLILFTEDGPSGEAIRILAQKILRNTNNSPHITRRYINRGQIFNPRKIIGLIKNERQEKKSKFIFCVDSECTDPAKIENDLQPCKRAVKKLQSTAHFLVIVHALETWLAADKRALAVILKTNREIHIPGNLERECRPAGILKEIFHKNNRKYIKSEHALTIARLADPAQIAKCSSSFRQFQSLIQTFL